MANIRRRRSAASDGRRGPRALGPLWLAQEERRDFAAHVVNWRRSVRRSELLLLLEDGLHLGVVAGNAAGQQERVGGGAPGPAKVVELQPLARVFHGYALPHEILHSLVHDLDVLHVLTDLVLGEQPAVPG